MSIINAITNEQNNDLCVLESVILMLKKANLQYRKAGELNLSDRARQYFSDKNGVYADYRETIMNDISTHYYKYKDELLKDVQNSKRQFLNEVIRIFPESSKLKPEEIVDGNNIIYEPLCKVIVEFDEKEENKKFEPLMDAMQNYVGNYINESMFKNYFSMACDIYSQTNEYGVIGFAPVCETCIKVPAWAIANIAENNNINLKDCKKMFIASGAKVQKLCKKMEKKNDEKLQQKYEYELGQFELASNLTEVCAEISDAIEHAYKRYCAATTVWKSNEVRGVFTEKVFELLNGYPKEIKKLNVNVPNLIISKEEAENIIYAAPLTIETIEAALVVADAANLTVNLGLHNYEYSKHVVEMLISNRNANAEEKARLLTELETANDSAEEKQEKQNVIKEIDDVEIAIGCLIMQTPFGVVKLQGNELVDVNTHKTYSVNKLKEYAFDNTMFHRVDENNKVISSKNFTDVYNNIMKLPKEPQNANVPMGKGIPGTN